MFGQSTQQQDLFSSLFAPKHVHHNAMPAEHPNSIPVHQPEKMNMNDPFAFMMPMHHATAAPQKQFNFFEQPIHMVRQWLA